MARRRFFVDEVRGGRALIAGDEAHHLTRVLRVEAGQKYEISDNRNVYLAEIEAARKDLVAFSIVETIPAGEPLLNVTLYASLIRFERFELLIEKATELGVERIVPVLAERSEKGLDRAAEKRAARWNRIAREASEQSRRVRLPAIADVLRFSQAVASPHRLRFALDENPGAEAILGALPEDRVPGADVALLVGPEGGWADRERAEFTSKQWTGVSLGRTVLKTETAVISALAILNAAWREAS